MAGCRNGMVHEDTSTLVKERCFAIDVLDRKPGETSAGVDVRCNNNLSAFESYAAITKISQEFGFREPGGG